MAAEVKVYCDVIGNQLVRGLQNSMGYVLPKFYQGAVYPFRFVPVIPTYAMTGNQFSAVSVAAMTLEISIGPRAGSEALLAYQGTFTPDTTNGWLAGNLDLNTTEMNTAVGTASSIKTFIEFAINDGGNKRTVYQQEVDIFAVVLGPTGAVDLPVSEDQFYTKAELDAMFVKWENSETQSLGKLLTLYSPDGTKGRSLGVSDAAEPIDYII